NIIPGIEVELILSLELPIVGGWERGGESWGGGSPVTKRPGLPSLSSAVPRWDSSVWTPHLNLWGFFAGHYSLTFHSTGVSTPDAGSPSFQVTVYLNGIPFLQYNSESQVAEPLGPWTQIKGMVDWQKETQLQMARQKTFMETLRNIMRYFQDGGNHTLEAKFGCELRDNNYCGAFWTYIYDGREYIKFAREIPAWFPRQTKAVFTKVKWESEGSVQAAKAYLEQECPRMLRNYLQYSKTFLDR
ncbi:zinc-alpha-2-glycoprotein, partial [Sturnira hondurensis]|uniref:zinc-alpha-2-glycoprotein n=1 Tax=Sturnira hondurensis TaxID=192404 RepID=UPI00187A8605